MISDYFGSKVIVLLALAAAYLFILAAILFYWFVSSLGRQKPKE